MDSLLDVLLTGTEGEPIRAHKMIFMADEERIQVRSHYHDDACPASRAAVKEHALAPQPLAMHGAGVVCQAVIR